MDLMVNSAAPNKVNYCTCVKLIMNLDCVLKPHTQLKSEG